MPAESGRTRTPPEAGVAHHAGEQLGRGKAPNALHQIGVGVALAGHRRAEQRNDSEGISVVQAFDAGGRAGAELEAEEAPAGPEHTPGFGQRALDPGQVADAEGDRAGIHRARPVEAAPRHRPPASRCRRRCLRSKCARGPRPPSARSHRRRSRGPGPPSRPARAGRCRRCRPPHRARPCRGGARATPPSPASRGDGCRRSSGRSSGRSGRRPGRKRSRTRPGFSCSPTRRKPKSAPSVASCSPRAEAMAATIAQRQNPRYRSRRMPELPEVETVRRGLAARLVGRRITHVTVRGPDLRRPLPPDMGQALTGRAVQGFGRRGKYLLVHLDSGSVLIVHLGMSGRLSIDAAPSGGAHEHVVLHFDDGAVLRYDDHRRFGLMDLTEAARLEEHELLRSMGPEPLAADFDGPALAKRLQGKDTPIKAALLDQRVVAGLGNIYVCEALFYAGAEPQAPRRLGARQARGPAGHSDPGRAGSGHRGRRIVASRLCAGVGRARLLSAPLRGLRPGGSALPRLRLRGRGAPHRAERALDILLR